MIKACRECGQQVSTDAANCPHCGALNDPGGRKVASRFLFFAVLLAVLWYVLVGY
jgi:predicted nucleic acid-binding Zn ribbon protein